ncbi:MAG TPA: hypothetical protein PK079_15695 [Leptospiraceae bacterium]|nr:hypothetical protein [Leptospiraceae bacterium]HMW07340.1 hypothetical protein [Leptospiraceae bacterium]HNA08197.1 hypothetical protein [Leptospiraceae bacterium]HNB99633.1 hypothetical protein [Leptospiraceae bacterium]HNC58080.1 hypothetical protein [Leptospiraceae bacterium]
MMEKENLKLIYDDEYNKLYFDEVNQYYVLWLMISHVMWYDIYIRLIDEEVKKILKPDGEINEVEFRHFANDIALCRPGLVGRYTPWDERILYRKNIEKEIE